MSAASHGAQAAPAQGKALGLRAHIQNVYHLVIKELRSIRADPMMLVLVAYAFSFAVYMVATGASTEARDLTIGVVDEDQSDLSGRLLGALNPPLIKRAVLITANEIDPNMDDGRLVFVLEIPPRFEQDLLAGRQASLQLNIDATAMSQAELPPPKSAVPHATTPPGRVTRRISAAAFSGSGITSIANSETQALNEAVA